MTNNQRIVHFVPGGWNGEEFVIAVCGAKISYAWASSLFTSCPECQKIKDAAEEANNPNVVS